MAAGQGAILLPCRPNATALWANIRDQFANYWGPRYMVETLFVTQVATERRGRCIWTVSLFRLDGEPIGEEEYNILRRRLKYELVRGAQFITCGRYTEIQEGVVAKYRPYDCECQVDFDAALTRSQICVPRYCSDLYFGMNTIVDMVSDLDQHQKDNFFKELLEDMINIDGSNNNQYDYIKLTFDYDDEDEDGCLTFVTNSVNVKLSEAIATIKFALKK